MVMTLFYTRQGAGTPLVLLHGIGSARQAWDPVLPALAQDFDVIAVDLPGFGESPPLPSQIERGPSQVGLGPVQVEPRPAALAQSVAALLDELDITRPHVAGNSLGGWVALELAALRPVASLTLLSPAGLWRGRSPAYNRVSLRASRWFAFHAGGLLSRLVETRPGRILVLGQTHGRPVRISPEYARMAVRALGTCPGFDATLRAADQGYRAGPPINAPVTVAFGSRDLLLRKASRCLDELPAGFRLASLPGCGHVPMADDPGAVAALIRSVASDQATGRPATEGEVPGPFAESSW
jgi:pimeloyl-ACP methyl ester carboxylesterase